MKATVNATCGFDTQAPAHRISDRQLIHESHEFSIDQWRGDPRKILLEPRPAINEAADPQISIPGFTEARVDSDGRPTSPNSPSSTTSEAQHERYGWGPCRSEEHKSELK